MDQYYGAPEDDLDIVEEGEEAPIEVNAILERVARRFLLRAAQDEMTMDNEMIRRVARTWVDRHIDPRTRKVTPTEFQVRELRLPVSDARFDRAMMLVARDMGGTYNRYTGIIHLPKELTDGGTMPFTELAVLYRKFPCGMMIKSQDSPVAGLPCVSFDVIPNVGSDPRRSKFYRSFQGEASTSKRMFNRFVAWMAILSRAIKRYRTQLERGGNPILRTAEEHVVALWLEEKASSGSHRSEPR
jgi:hypothetical protein